MNFETIGLNEFNKILEERIDVKYDEEILVLRMMRPNMEHFKSLTINKISLGKLFSFSKINNDEIQLITSEKTNKITVLEINKALNFDQIISKSDKNSFTFIWPKVTLELKQLMTTRIQDLSLSVTRKIQDKRHLIKQEIDKIKNKDQKYLLTNTLEKFLSSYKPKISAELARECKSIINRI